MEKCSSALVWASISPGLLQHVPNCLPCFSFPLTPTKACWTQQVELGPATLWFQTLVILDFTQINRQSTTVCLTKLNKLFPLTSSSFCILSSSQFLLFLQRLLDLLCLRAIPPQHNSNSSKKNSASCLITCYVIYLSFSSPRWEFLTLYTETWCVCNKYYLYLLHLLHPWSFQFYIPKIFACI